MLVMAMGIVARSTSLARVSGMSRTMRVDGPDVLEVERRLELPRGRKRMLSARADGRSGMLLVVNVVVVGRGRHPLLTTRRRVEDLALLSWLDAGRRDELLDTVGGSAEVRSISISIVIIVVRRASCIVRRASCIARFAFGCLEFEIRMAIGIGIRFRG